MVLFLDPSEDTAYSFIFISSSWSCFFWSINSLKSGTVWRHVYLLDHCPQLTWFVNDYKLFIQMPHYSYEQNNSFSASMLCSITSGFSEKFNMPAQNLWISTTLVIFGGRSLWTQIHSYVSESKSFKPWLTEIWPIQFVKRKWPTCCSWGTPADVTCRLFVVIAFRQKRLTAIQGMPRSLNAAAAISARAAATLTDVCLTMTALKPWNEEGYLMWSTLHMMFIKDDTGTGCSGQSRCE